MIDKVHDSSDTSNSANLGIQSRDDPEREKAEDKPYKVVTYKRKKSRDSTYVGSKDIVGGCELSGAESKMWLFVGRTKPGTTKQAVLNYLKSEVPGEEFICENIETAGANPCFKVGARMDLKQRLECSDFWPRGVVVRRYNFRVSRHFLEKKTTGQFAR